MPLSLINSSPFKNKQFKKLITTYLKKSGFEYTPPEDTTPTTELLPTPKVSKPKQPVVKSPPKVTAVQEVTPSEPSVEFDAPEYDVDIPEIEDVETPSMEEGEQPTTVAQEPYQSNFDMPSEDEIQERYVPKALKIAQKIVGNKHDAQEVVDRVMEVVRNNPEIASSAFSFQSWFRNLVEEEAEGTKQKPAKKKPESEFDVEEELEAHGANIKDKKVTPTDYGVVDPELVTWIQNKVNETNQAQKELKNLSVEGYTWDEHNRLKKKYDDLQKETERYLREDIGLTGPAKYIAISLYRWGMRDAHKKISNSIRFPSKGDKEEYSERVMPSFGKLYTLLEKEGYDHNTAEEIALQVRKAFDDDGDYDDGVDKAEDKWQELVNKSRIENNAGEAYKNAVNHFRNKYNMISRAKAAFPELTMGQIQRLPLNPHVGTYSKILRKNNISVNGLREKALIALLRVDLKDVEGAIKFLKKINGKMWKVKYHYPTRNGEQGDILDDWIQGKTYEEAKARLQKKRGSAVVLDNKNRPFRYVFNQLYSPKILKTFANHPARDFLRSDQVNILLEHQGWEKALPKKDDALAAVRGWKLIETPSPKIAKFVGNLQSGYQKMAAIVTQGNLDNDYYMVDMPNEKLEWLFFEEFDNVVKRPRADLYEQAQLVYGRSERFFSKQNLSRVFSEWFLSAIGPKATYDIVQEFARMNGATAIATAVKGLHGVSPKALKDSLDFLRVYLGDGNAAPLWALRLAATFGNSWKKWVDKTVGSAIQFAEKGKIQELPIYEDSGEIDWRFYTGEEDYGISYNVGNDLENEYIVLLNTMYAKETGFDIFANGMPSRKKLKQILMQEYEQNDELSDTIVNNVFEAYTGVSANDYPESLAVKQARERFEKLMEIWAAQNQRKYVVVGPEERQNIIKQANKQINERYKELVRKKRKEDLDLKIHDAVYFLPKAKADPKLSEYLIKNATPRILNEQNNIKAICENWKEVDPSEYNLPIDELAASIIQKVNYPNAKSPGFAREAAKWGASRYDYERIEKKFVASQKIPHFHPNKKYKSGKYEAYFMKRSDPRGMFLGQYTNCCQTPGGAGETCAYYGQEKENSGFFVIEDTEKKEIIAQSWTWTTAGGLVFDNIEAKGLEGEREKACIDLYEKAANDLIKDYGSVNVGTGLGDLPVEQWKTEQKIKYQPGQKYELTDVYGIEGFDSEGPGQGFMVETPSERPWVVEKWNNDKWLAGDGDCGYKEGFDSKEAAAQWCLEQGGERESKDAIHIPLPIDYGANYSDAARQVTIARDPDFVPPKIKNSIVQLREEDTDAVAEIAKAVYPDGWQNIDYEELTDAMGMVVNQGTPEERLVGYILLSKRAEENEVLDMAILPDFKKYGFSLVNGFINSIGDEWWTATARESTSYKLLKAYQKRGRIELIEGEEDIKMGEDRMINVKFRKIQ